MIWAPAIVAALWPTVALAQDAGVIPVPGSWWEAILGIVVVILSGGYGGSTILSRMRQGGGPDSEVLARVKAIEDAGRASREQAAMADLVRRIGEVETQQQARAAEIATLRAMVSQASERTAAGLDSVAASLQRLEGG